MAKENDSEKRDARIYTNRVLIHELLKKEMKNNGISFSGLRNFDQEWGLDRAGNLWNLKHENAVYRFRFYVAFHNPNSWTTQTKFSVIKIGAGLSSSDEDRLDAELRESITGAVRQLKKEYYGK